jgi:hypothetical protein
MGIPAFRLYRSLQDIAGVALALLSFFVESLKGNATAYGKNPR